MNDKIKELTVKEVWFRKYDSEGNMIEESVTRIPIYVVPQNCCLPSHGKVSLLPLEKRQGFPGYPGYPHREAYLRRIEPPLSEDYIFEILNGRLYCKDSLGIIFDPAFQHLD